MVTVSIEGNSFKVKGTFDCGILGVFRDDRIQIDFDDVQDTRDSGGLPGIDTLTCSDEELAACVTEIANQQEAKLQENISQFNENILREVYRWMHGCGYPFWEHPNFVNQTFMQEHPDYKVDYSNVFAGVPADLDYEARLRAAFPSFNWDYFLSHIVQEKLTICTRGGFDIDCTDVEGVILGCCYIQVDENLKIWNFDNHG